jgi:AmiR/NasT family two-component response regulator
MTARATAVTPPLGHGPPVGQAPPAPHGGSPRSAHDLAEAIFRARKACDRARRLVEQARCLQAQIEETQAAADSRIAQALGNPSRTRKALLQRSEYARLLARLQTMPVIEQAKGIIMAQSRCGQAEAFDLLRRASQRGNVPVRDLAAQLVAKTTRARPSPQGETAART